ncbi:uncharacterized protein LOC122379733 isoform X1 [Amphibalanus amphitrite]|uniref:uncharacterized protein LOC122379733 isoform X1 n=2 Tax=Amphibalanus amphitrite TaxID=1232801 RepID=UPI001C92477C|nr:uncharacterized protein LOC122379733 isoform X1 [Amphibalanus amphitrite]
MATVSRLRPDSLAYCAPSEEVVGRRRRRPDSLSTGLTPPPTDTRLPPDGHEFPPEFRDREQTPSPGDPTGHGGRSGLDADQKGESQSQSRTMLLDEPGLFFGTSPQRRGCQRSESMVERDGGSPGDFRSRVMGEHDLRKSKSGTSVRDRIALFSSPSKESLSGSRTLLTSQAGCERETSLDSSRLSQGRSQGRSKSDLKLTGNESQRCRSRDDVVRRKKISDPSGDKYGSLTRLRGKDGDQSPGTDSSSCSSQCSLPVPPSHSRESSTARSESSGDEGNSPLHERSQSLFDLGHTEKRHSYAGMQSKAYGHQSQSANLPRKTSLNSIMEERKKSFSKLRGLIIPSKVDVTKRGPADMPAIKSKDLRVLAKPTARLLSPVASPNRSRLSTPERLELPEPRHLTSPPWKGDASSTLPAYSPAFKRKNVSVYSSPGSAFRSVSSSARLGGSSIELSRATPHDTASRRQEPRGGARSGLQRTPPAKEPLQRSSSLNSRPPAGAGDSRRRISDDVGPLEGRRLPARIQPADSDTDVGSSTLTLVAEPLEETSTSRGLRSRAGSFDFDHRASTSTLHASSPVKELDVEEEIRKAAAGEPSRNRSPSLKAPGPATQQERSERVSGSPPKIQEDAAWRKFSSTTDSNVTGPCAGESRDLSKLRQSNKASVKSLKERWQMMSDISETSSASVSRSPSLRSDRPDVIIRDPISRESVPRDSVPRETSTCQSVSRESVTTDSSSDDSASRNTVSRESETVSNETVSHESITQESSTLETVTTTSSLAEHIPSTALSKETPTSVRDVVDRNWPSIESERADIDRKLSTPSYGGSTPTRLRDRRGHVPSRPQSWVESEQELRILETAGGLLSAGGGAISTSSSQENIMDSLDCGKSPSGSTSSLLEMLTANLKRNARSRHVLSVSDLRRAFERSDGRTCHARMSSMDSTGSEDGPGVAAMMGSSAREHYGSITSLASSTSLISPHELQQLIEEANQSLEEAGTPSHEIIVAVVHREMMGGSIGITLAGGADYENKEISVNKVIRGSVADRDGRIQKGDRVISINGRSMKNTTHREALNTLKAPRAEVVLVLSRSRSVTPLDAATDENGSAVHRPSVINTFSSRPPKILESPMDSKSLASDLAFEDVPRGPPKVVTLVKEGAGVGFSLEGGKDSPLGDRPLMAKKIFAGGAADKSGKLHIGDQILAINDEDVTHMPRIEAWNFLKKQPEGALRLTIRKRLAAGETPAPSASNGSPLLPPGENGGLRAEAPTSRNGSTRPTVTAVTPKVPLQSPEAVLPKA